MEEIENESVHLIYTSPPYWGADMWNELWESFGIDIKDPAVGFEESHDYLARIWRECYRVLMKGCRLIINIGDIDAKPGAVYGRWMNSWAVGQRCLALGLIIREDIIWHKPLGTHLSPISSFPNPGKILWCNITEHNLVFEKKGQRDTSNIPPKIKEASLLKREHLPWLYDNVWTIRPASATREQHIAPFPLELPTRFILLHTYINDIVLDPFLGSGTTMLAARNTLRNCIGYEIEEKYLNVILNKLKARQKRFKITDTFRVIYPDNKMKEWTV